MYMRMIEEVLPPGMQHTEEADLSSEMARVGGCLEQGLRAGTQQ